MIIIFPVKKSYEVKISKFNTYAKNRAWGAKHGQHFILVIQKLY